MAIITSEQYRMARAVLRLSVRDVATMSNVSTNTLARLENGEDLKPRTLEAIRNAFEMPALNSRTVISRVYG